MRDSGLERKVAVLLVVGPDQLRASTRVAVASVVPELVVVRLDGEARADDELMLPRDVAELASRVRGSSVVLVDGRCTGIDAELISDALERAVEISTVFVQPALETLKLVRADRVISTVDRELVRVVSTPVVLGGDVLMAVRDLLAALRDPAVLVAELRRVGSVDLVEAPAHVRRESAAARSVG